MCVVNNINMAKWLLFNHYNIIKVSRHHSDYGIDEILS